MPIMHPVTIDAVDATKWVARLWWPVLRIGGFVATAPIASEKTVPTPVKIALTLGLAFVLRRSPRYRQDSRFSRGRG